MVIVMRELFPNKSVRKWEEDGIFLVWGRTGQVALFYEDYPTNIKDVTFEFEFKTNTTIHQIQCCCSTLCYHMLTTK